MFGFFFNKKSKSFDKDNNGKSSGGGKKSKDGKESTNGAGEGVSSQNNSNSDSSSSGDFLLSSTTDSESSDLKTSQSTGSLPSNNNQYDDSDIQSAFNSHEDIPFHDEDTTEEEGDGCSGDPKKNSVVFSENRSFNNGPSREIPLANRRIPSNVSIADSNKLVRLSSSPTKSELSLKFQRERDASELERKTLAQLEEVRSKLLAKETEISILQADINMLTVDRDNKVVEMEGLATQIMVLTVENESALEKISKLEAEVEVLRLKNQELTEELLKKTEQLKNVETTTQKSDKTATDLQAKVKDLEEKLKDAEVERDKLQEERDSFESEREEELRAMQNALDDAIEAKIKIQNKFERDFEELRTTNASQEQQLMEDFEWKLRQIEQSCKKKLQEKDRQVEEKLKEARLLEVTEIGAEREQLRLERRQVEEQMREVIHLKSYEAEVVQLRGVVHEQQKALRAAARQLEHLKLNDKLLQDEIRTLKVNLEKEKAHSQVIQASNQRKFDAQEENLQSKLDKQKSELNALWEDRCRAECTRLKEDLGKLHAEEKNLAVETMKIQKDQDLAAAKHAWERQREQLVQDISKLNDTITEKENRYHREVEKITAQADRDGWEMRRKLDKLTNGHMEQIEKLKESHEKEIDELKEVHEEALNRISELERQLQEAIKSQQQQLSQTKESLQPPAASVGIPVEVQSITVVPINNKKQDSGSDSSEEEEETEESEESDEYSSSSSKAVDNGIDGLRKEVAHLQGSIEKLTSDLTQGSEDAPVSHSISTSATSQSCTSETAPSTGDTSGSGESDEDDDE